MVPEMDKDSIMSIPEYFAGQSIFITGGTGLMGKVLIEKILRSCPDVDKIYLLIRPKKCVPVDERWSKITQLPLFERLQYEKPETLKKVVLIPGNIADEDLSISTEHKKLLEENVTMIYHMAAMIQFTDSVTDALIENVRGTLTMLELGKTIKKLKVFVHVSTAYSNFNIPCADATEKVHPCCQDWKVLLKLLKSEPNVLCSLREKLLCGHPNPYTWSKSMTEQIVNEYSKFYPVIIMRPGIVSATIQDPFPSWNDGTNAYFSMAALAAFGVLRVFKGAKDSHQDLVPVDIAVKAFLITPWKLHISEQQKQPMVYNCTTASDEVITYEYMESMLPQFLKDYPSKYIIWPPFCLHVKNSFIHFILFFFLQIVPGIILDLLLLLCRKKTIFTSLNKKIINGYRMAQDIIDNKVTFPNKHFKELTTILKAEDIKEFNYVIKHSDEQKSKMFMDQVSGFLKYFLKEEMSEENIKKNRKRYQRIKMAHNILIVIGEFICSWYLMYGIGRSIAFFSYQCFVEYDPRYYKHD